MSKNVVETEGPQMTSQYGAYALRAGLARVHTRMRMHMPTRPGANLHARTQARTRKHTHTDGLVKAPQCYGIRTLPVLFVFFVEADSEFLQSVTLKIYRFFADEWISYF
jgi:hypothetical protein